jgi:O-antigen/teichoic acid export membrane protein
MKQKAIQFLKHPLIYGSSIVVVGGLIANFFNFLFNLFMSRNLSIPDYGILANIVSIITFPALIAGAVNPLIIRFSGSYFANERYDLIRGLYIKILKFLLPLGTFASLFFILNISNISNFFHIENRPVLVITSAMIFFAFLGVLNMALLQAKLAFGYQVFLNLLGAVTKLLLGMLFVVTGYSVTGATSAMLIATILIYSASFFPIRFIFNHKLVTESIINTRELFSYGIPSALTLLGLTSFISMDILLVKHFFDPVNAGIYAGLSLIGRVIFYISFPIGSVMFPIIVKKHAKNENFHNTFKLSLALVFLPSLLITIFYYSFPKFSILFFLKKPEYLSIEPLLGLFALFISTYCLLFIISTFYLSIKKVFIYIPILIGASLQMILIFFYHQSFLQIIIISLSITFLLVLGLLLYYPHASRKKQ